MEWPNTVARVKDGETTFSAQDMNKIIDALIARTDVLKASIDMLGGSQGFILPVQGIPKNCAQGDLIAVDRDGTYKKATAEWGTVMNPDGSYTASPLASVIGVLMNSPDANTNATLLCCGWTADATLVKRLAPDGIVGDYYLTVDGKATCISEDIPGLRVYCYSYLPSNRIFFRPSLPMYGGHAHNYIEITTPWIPAINSVVSLPAGAQVVTDTAASPALQEAVLNNPQQACLMKNGIEIVKSAWGIVDHFIYMDFVPLASDVITLHMITPFTGDEPVIRGIKTTPENKLLTVETVGGKSWIGLNNAGIDDAHYSGKAVTQIDDNGLKLGPVIQGIKAGAGIDVAPYYDKGNAIAGVFEISSQQYKNTLIDMNLCNLNGVLVGTTAEDVSYVFPGNGVTSSLTGTIRVPHFPDNPSQQGELVFIFQGTGQAINGLTASVLVQPIPASGDSCALLAPVVHSVPAISGSALDSCYCSVIELGGDNQVLYSDALITCTIRSTGGSEIRLLSVSLRLK